MLIWASCCLCFFAFLRAGELTVPKDNACLPGIHLSVSDIALDDPKRSSFLRVTIKQSKTDPFQQGINIFVGMTRTDLCPVAALQDYLHIRGTAAGPLFLDGRVLSRFRFVSLVCNALEKAGVAEVLQSQFLDRHCYDGRRKRDQDCINKTFGRWESLTYLQYVKFPREQLAGYSTLLASP